MKNSNISRGIILGIVCISMPLDSRFDKKRRDDNKNQNIEVVKSGDDMLNKADQKISEIMLNKLLASESVMLIQTLNYHWNLVGPEFHDYHLLFDKQYNVLFADMDKLAERVRAIGGQAAGSMKEILSISPLKEDTGKLPEPKKMVVNLLKQYESLIEQLRDGITHLEKSKDYGTRKFLEDLIEQHEKTAWMLRALTGKQ